LRRLKAATRSAQPAQRPRGGHRPFNCFHGSEVAFWPNAKTHFAGVVQAIPDLPGTEIVLESTANGLGGEFHERWQQAESGQGDYEAIFIPWFWDTDIAGSPARLSARR
jgi:hypothetical protein